MPPPERDIVGSVNAVIEAESVREAVRIRPQKESANPGRMRLRATAVAGVCALAGVAACVGAWRVHHVNGGVRETVSSAVSAAMSNAAAALPSQPDQLLGHFRTTEAPEWDLAPVLADGSVKLRCAAAASFLSMQEAADWDGVYLVPLSGFRSVADQERVFFDIKAERAQMAHQRAEVSAPPGYSEHHTGYAIDVGDGRAAGTHLEWEFDETPAYRWLKKNAGRFHFEMSFPKDNEYGIMYEPWHWRYVGDNHSLECFYGRQRIGTKAPRPMSTT